MNSKFFSVILIAAVLSACQNQTPNSKETASDIDSTKIKEQTSVNVAEVTLASTVSITMQDKNRQTFALGSGAIIDDGIVITNLHVIAGASFGYVQLNNDQQKHSIEGYLAIDKVNDLALLSVPTLTTKGLKLQTTSPKVGEKIFAAGNPQGLSGTFSEGIVSSLRDFDNKSLIQITAPISPGSSGGPIVNANAELIGIAVGGFTEGQNLNFAIPSHYVAELLNNKSALSSLNISKGKSQSQSSNSSKNVQTDLRDVVKIRNLKWSHDDRIAQGFSDPFFLKDANYLEELSILNNSSYPISNIKIFFIVYDRTGTPVDYGGIQVLPTGQGTIMPGLARTFTGLGLSVDKKVGYKCEVRLLDFQIHYDN